MTQKSKNKNMNEQERKSFIVNTYVNWLSILKSVIKTKEHENEIKKLEKEKNEMAEEINQLKMKN